MNRKLVYCRTLGNGVHLVDVKSDEHTIDLIFNCIVYTIAKEQ